MYGRGRGSHLVVLRDDTQAPGLSVTFPAETSPWLESCFQFSFLLLHECVKMPSLGGLMPESDLPLEEVLITPYRLRNDVYCSGRLLCVNQSSKS